MTINGLSAILHSVTVKDARSCTANTSQTISQPPLLTASSTKVDVSCNGSSDGSMTVTFDGRTGPYHVSLDGGAFAVATSPTTFNGLSAILHSVTVKDARSCTANTSQTISQPHRKSTRLTSSHEISTYSSDGSMTVTFGGGTGPYQVSLDGGAFAVATSPTTFNGLSARSEERRVGEECSCRGMTSQSIRKQPLVTARSTNAGGSWKGMED